MGAEGWTFEPGPEVIPDGVNHVRRSTSSTRSRIRHYSGRVDRAVSVGTRSGHDRVERIGRDRAHAEQRASTRPAPTIWTFIPEPLRDEIDELNAFIYPNVNNGVYRAGFATTQEAYEEAAIALFDALDSLEDRLETRRYLTGPRSPRPTAVYSRR